MGETPEHLKQYAFSSTNQPAGRGRKPSILAEISRLTGTDFKLNLTRQQKYELIEAMLERTVEELQELQASTVIPAFMIAISKSILRDIESSNISTVETIFDRIFGKPKLAVDNNLSGKIDFIVKYDTPGLMDDVRD